MRVVDLVLPLVPGLRRVIDVNTGTIDLERYLPLPAEVSYVRAPAEQLPSLDVRSGDLVIAVDGPDPVVHGDARLFFAALGSWPTGARGVVLLGHPPDATPGHRLLDALGASRCQIEHVAELHYDRLATGVRFVRVQQPLPPAGFGGRPARSPESEAATPETLVRVVNEHAWMVHLERALRRRHEDNEVALQRARLRARRADVQRAARSGALTAAAGLAEAQRDVLRRELERTLKQLRLAERRLSRVEASTSLAVGRLAVGVGRRPLRDGPRFPGRLLRLWRRRRAPRSAGDPADPPEALIEKLLSDVTPSRAHVDPGRRRAAAASLLLLGSGPPGAGPGRPVVAGLLSAETEATLEPDANVLDLAPHDAQVRFDAVPVDLLLIDAAVAVQGSWRGLGEASASRLTRTLSDLLDEAEARGVPSVFWGRAIGPVAALLAEVSGRCALVVGDWPESSLPAWDIGVQLGRYAKAAGGRRDSASLLLSSAPLGERELAALPPDVRVVVDELGFRDSADRWSWRDAPDEYARTAAAAVVGGSESWRRRRQGELAAAGVRAVALAGPDELGAEVFQASPLTLDEHRRVIRDVATAGGPHVALDQVLALLERRPLFAAQRHVGVLANLEGPAMERALIEECLAQTHRPHAVVVVGASDRALDELLAAGITVSTGTEGSPSARELPALVQWGLHWRPGDLAEPECLRDLVAAAAALRPDVIGVRRDERDLVFGPEVDRPLLVRSDLLHQPSAEPEQMVARGLRVAGVRRVDGVVGAP